MIRRNAPRLVHPLDDVRDYELSHLAATAPRDLRRAIDRLSRVRGVDLPADDPTVVGGLISDGTALQNLLAWAESQGFIRNGTAAGAFAELPDENSPFHLQRVMQYLADATNGGAATLTNAGFPAAPTLDGTLANVDDTAGAWLRATTADSLGANSGLTTAFTYAWPDWQPTLIVKLRVGSSIASVRLWVALTSATVDGSANPAGHHAGFRFDSGSDQNGGVNTWRLCAKDGTTQTTTFGDNPVQISTSDVVRLQVGLRPGQAIYTINDVEVGRITTNLPASGQPLGIQVRCRKLDAAGSGGKFLRLARVTLMHQ